MPHTTPPSRVAWFLAVSLLVVSGCASEHAGRFATAVQPASIAPLHPDRPRYRYEHPPVELRFPVQRVDLWVNDDRFVVRRDDLGSPVLSAPTGEEPVEASVHRAFEQALQRRLASLSTPSASQEAASLLLEVEQVRAFRGRDYREVSVALRAALVTADGDVLARGRGEGGLSLRGAPYDAEELEALHLGACLEAADALLAPEFLAEANVAFGKRAHDPSVADPQSAVDTPRPSDASRVPTSAEDSSHAERMADYKHAIRKVMLEDKVDDVHTCLTRHSVSDFRYIIHFAIDATGQVIQAAPVALDPALSEFSRCFVTKFVSWRFPPTPGGGTIVVDYPYVIENRP